MYAPLQCLVRSFERFRRLDAGGDISESGDDAAIRHTIGAHLDHDALGESFKEWLVARHVAFDLRLHEVLDALRSFVTAPAVEAQNVGQSNAGTDQARWQVENFAELAIPADQLQVSVEHRDTLTHVIKGGLQDFTVVLGGGIR